MAGLSNASHANGARHLGIEVSASTIRLVHSIEDLSNERTLDRFSLLCFEPNQIDQCLDYIRELAKSQALDQNGCSEPLSLVGTLAHASEFWDCLCREPGLRAQCHGKLDSTVNGAQYIISQLPREMFLYDEGERIPCKVSTTSPEPYLIVDIGSELSFIRVNGQGQHDLLGSNCFGVASLCGLVSLLGGPISFDEIVRLAEKGDSTKVDKLVGDIYGREYAKIGFKDTFIASTFGKVFSILRESPAGYENGGQIPMAENCETPPSAFEKADVCASLLFAVFNNIGQFANLYSECHQIIDVYFVGSAIRWHPRVLRILTASLKFYSKDKKRALFLGKELFVAALGAWASHEAS